MSSWDVFSHKAAKTYKGQNGDTADMSYTNFLKDVMALKTMGVNIAVYTCSTYSRWVGGVG